MRQLPVRFVTILIGFALAADGGAAVLPKDVAAVRESFDKVGATSCSLALAEALNFLAKGRAITSNRQWNTGDPNKKPISVDFLIAGTKSAYSSSGAIVLAPTGSKCTGNYIVTYVAPSENCKAYMQKEGFDGPDWNQDIVDPNGDGGQVYFLSPKKNNGLNFIFNDVAGGCSVTKRETLTVDIAK